LHSLAKRRQSLPAMPKRRSKHSVRTQRIRNSVRASLREPKRASLRLERESVAFARDSSILSALGTPVIIEGIEGQGSPESALGVTSDEDPRPSNTTTATSQNLTHTHTTSPKHDERIMFCEPRGHGHEKYHSPRSSTTSFKTVKARNSGWRKAIHRDDPDASTDTCTSRSTTIAYASRSSSIDQHTSWHQRTTRASLERQFQNEKKKRDSLSSIKPLYAEGHVEGTHSEAIEVEEAQATYKDWANKEWKSPTISSPSLSDSTTEQYTSTTSKESLTFKSGEGNATSFTERHILEHTIELYE